MDYSSCRCDGASLLCSRCESHAELKPAIAGEISGTENGHPHDNAEKSRHGRARGNHSAPPRWIRMEGMVSCEDFFQFVQAKATHKALQTVASESARYPTGREMSKA